MSSGLIDFLRSRLLLFHFESFFMREAERESKEEDHNDEIL